MQTILANSIICGDCRDKMKQHIPSESVDLIYMDPPFFSGKNYEVIWKDGAEVRSFEDTEFYTLECECGKVFPENHLYCAFCGAGKDNAKERRSNDIEAYLQWLRPKLDECYRVLKHTGSMYVHLDHHAVHYVKMMMDEIFGGGDVMKGIKCFRNEIVWCYTGPSNTKRWFPRKHDTILFYSKSNEWQFNREDVLVPYKESTVSRANYGAAGFKNKDGNPSDYLDKSGKLPEDWWVGMSPVGRSKTENMGYPTQKPESLLERIISASSNPGDIILDPFCGCGTAVAVAERLNRRWIGIDVSPTSCKLMTDRLRSLTRTLKSGKKESIGYSIGYSDIIDMPMTEEELRKLPPFEFQNWAVQQLGGRQQVRKAGDGGIDGWTFEGDPIQVKQKDKADPDTIKLLAYNTQRIGKTHGIVVAFGYTSGVHKAVDEAKTQFGIDIELKTVEDML